MARELPKVYEPQQVESKIYDMWQQGGYFHAEVDESKKPFTIVMPPPNVTGQLHMGHAMDATLQDTLIRFKRMQAITPVDSRRRSRRHRHPDQGGGGASQGGPDPLRSWS